MLRPSDDATPGAAASIRDLVAAWGQADAPEIVADALRRFAGHIALVSSFGADAAALLHMVARLDPATPVILVDTRRLFPETLAYRDTLVARLGLRDVRTVRPAAEALARLDQHDTLAGQDPDACCALRKVSPFETAIAPFAALLTGRRRDQAVTRRDLSPAEWDGARIRINPLAGWTAERAAAWRRAHALPDHPLAPQGYPSIGCVPCTSRVAADEDRRAGRWRGFEKTECGLHGRRRIAVTTES